MRSCHVFRAWTRHAARVASTTVLQLRIYASADLADRALALLEDEPSVSAIGVVRGGSVRPPGDLLLADVAREAVNDLIDGLEQLGVQHQGTIHVESARTWISRPGLVAERRTPGSSADAVVWADVVQGAYDARCGSVSRRLR